MTGVLNGEAPTTRGRRGAKSADSSTPGLRLSPSEAARLAAELDALATAIERPPTEQHDGVGVRLDPITADRVEFLRDQAQALRTLHTASEDSA